MLSTPHVPHSWDAVMLYEESTGTLFASDLFSAFGEVGVTTDGDIVGPALAAEKAFPAAAITPLAAPTLLTPSATSATNTFNYTFTPVAGATGYMVRLAGVGDTAWYTPTAAGCTGNVGICSIPQVTPLVDGQGYTWFAIAQNSAGNGPWSAYTYFVVNSVPLPAAPTLLTPSATSATTTFNYTFSPVAGATGYMVRLVGSADTAWYTPAAAGCTGNIGTCSIPQVTPLVSGQGYIWYAMAQNSAGNGPWSTYMYFGVQ